MNNETILKQAKQKALSNVKDKAKFYASIGRMEEANASVIFSHEFAKAFYGEEHKVNSFVPDYLYHLQQQVIYEVDGKEAPLKYIEQFLTNQKTTTTELCGCEADEQGIEHTIADHFPEGEKFMNNKTTTELSKMIRAIACSRLWNHEYKLIKESENRFLYECKHCKDWWQVDRRISDEELQEILMRH